MNNKILECIYSRRSTRKYLDKKISKRIINEILKAGVMAPSAMNSQPWRFSIVQGKKNILKYGKIVFKEKNKLDCLEYSPKKPEHIFYNAPILIIVSGKKGYKYLKDDINLAVQNMFLAAHSLGIGSCWIGFANSLENNNKVKKELGIKKDMEIVAPLIFGYPKYINNNIPKRDVKILKWIQ